MTHVDGTGMAASDDEVDGDTGSSDGALVVVMSALLSAKKITIILNRITHTLLMYTHNRCETI